jgi:hypothetical protein
MELDKVLRSVMTVIRKIMMVATRIVKEKLGLTAQERIKPVKMCVYLFAGMGI